MTCHFSHSINTSTKQYFLKFCISSVWIKVFIVNWTTAKSEESTKFKCNRTNEIFALNSHTLDLGLEEFIQPLGRFLILILNKNFIQYFDKKIYLQGMHESSSCLLFLSLYSLSFLFKIIFWLIFSPFWFLSRKSLLFY